MSLLDGEVLDLYLPTVGHAGCEERRAGGIGERRPGQVGLLPDEPLRPEEADCVAQAVGAAPFQDRRSQQLSIPWREEEGRLLDTAGRQGDVGQLLLLP